MKMINVLRSYVLLVILILSGFCYSLVARPKHEFRGVWVHTVHQNQYATMNKDQMQRYFINMLDTYQRMGINAFIFQVRPQADAFYLSELEPVSRFWTGAQGKNPSEKWDPMAFLIDECHKRGMEFHAWLNPYRVTSSDKERLAEGHIYFKHPNWFLKYGNQIYFDAGLPQCRKHITNVVKDIVSRYDVDAIHMDDYFYPYPIAGKEYPDGDTFNALASSQGFGPGQRDDWRRNNVNTLISEIKSTIVDTKPWVRFGISPFGIYRNKKNHPAGSETNGLENYGDLYADVQLWSKNGWADYIIPQLYWEIGNRAADYETLVKWWSNQKGPEHLYIGQSIVRTINNSDKNKAGSNQLTRKMQLIEDSKNISGNCWWNGYDLLQNFGGIADSLTNNYHSTVALVPAYESMYNKKPKEVSGLKAEWKPEGYFLTWKVGKQKDQGNAPSRFAVYCFNDGEKVDLNNPDKIVAVTGNTELFLPYEKGTEKYTYVVTSINRYNFESKKGKKKSIKL